MADNAFKILSAQLQIMIQNTHGMHLQNDVKPMKQQCNEFAMWFV